MSELSQKLLEAKEALAPVKAQGSNAITDAKARLFAKPSDSDPFQQELNKVRDDTLEDLSQRLPDPKRIIQQQDNVILREDGSISIVLHDGKVLDNVDPDLVPELLAIENEKLKAVQSGTSDNTFINDLAGLTQSGVDIVKGLSSSAFGVEEELRKTSTGEGTFGGTEQTLSAALEMYNAGVRANRHGASLNIPKDAQTISPNALIDYKAVSKSLVEGTPLTPAQKEFSQSDTFRTIFDLQQEVAASNKSFAKIEDTAEFVKSFVPTDRTKDVTTALAFKRVAENEGTLAAIKNTLVNDTQVLISQGFQSIPYMIAFTAGGPITQSAVLVGLSKQKSRDVTDDFINEYNREPSIEEQNRIDMWSAVSTVAEKFGDMAALGIITRSKIPRIFNTKRIVESILPESVKRLLKTPVARGTLAATGLSTKVGQRVAKGLTGEAASGGITSAADQIALTGTIDDPSQIAFDALSEAVGTVGGLGGILAGRIARSTLSTTKDVVATLRKDAEADGGAESTDVSAPPPSPVGGSALLQDAEPVNTERIEVSAFDKTIDDIKTKINDITPRGIRETFLKLSRLGRRALTKEQAEKHKTAVDTHVKNLRDITNFKPDILGSLGPIDELTPKDLQELSVNQDATEADRLYIDSIIEAQELADEITVDAENVQDLDETTKPVTVIEDFNNLLTEIQGVASDPAFGTLETKTARTNSLISQLGTQLTNIENKLAAVIEAGRFTPKPGEFAAIRSTRINPEDPNDLGVEFSEPLSLSEAQIVEEESQEGVDIIRVDSSSTEQVDRLNKEVEFGNIIVNLAKAHGDTSFAKSATELRATQRLAADAVKQLEAQPPPTISTEKVDTEISNIKDPTKTSPTVVKTSDKRKALLAAERKAEEEVSRAVAEKNKIADEEGPGPLLEAAFDKIEDAKAALDRAAKAVDDDVKKQRDDTKPAKESTKKPKPKVKSLAQEFINPTEFLDPKDPANINSDLWDKKEIPVVLNNGKTVKVNAGKQWLSLHKALHNINNLIECVGS